MIYNRNEIEKTRYIKLKGLNDDDTYEISFASGAATVTETGRYLMNRGVKVKVKSSDVMYIKRTNKVETDLTAFNQALESCKKLKTNIMTIQSAFEIVKAISYAESLVQAGDTVKAINYTIAADLLNKAKKGQKIASPSESAEQKDAQLSEVIDYIGEVTVDNFRQKITFIEFAETVKAALLKKYPDATVTGDQKLIDARASYEKLIAEPQPDYAYGDMDGSGSITANDALVALQISVGLVDATDIQLIVGDVDSDGEITANDALMILQASVGLRNAADFPLTK